MILLNLHKQLINILESFKNEDKLKTKFFKHVSIWNQQIDESVQTGENNTYVFKDPSCFIEFDMGECMMLGGKVKSYPNMMIRFHLYHINLNTTNQIDANLKVFSLRDRLLVGPISLDNCSSLILVEDKPDYSHNNVYKYIVGFKTNFIDITGSRFDTVNKVVCTGVIKSFEVWINENLNIINNVNVNLDGYEITYTVNSLNSTLIDGVSQTFTDTIPTGALIKDVIYVGNGEINGWFLQGITRDAITKTWNFSSLGGLQEGTIITIRYAF